MEEQQDLARAKVVSASADAAKRIVASRGDASKKVAKILARGPLPPQVGSESLWHEDNKAATARVADKSMREVFAESVAPLAKDGLLGGLLPSALASIVLTNYDLESKCPLERIPRSKLTVERVMAHVESLGTGMDHALIGQVARRLTMILLNYEADRRPMAEVVANPQAEDVDEYAEPGDREADGAPARDDVESEATRAGRQVRGYARVTNEMGWAQGTTATPVGTVFEVLSPNERDQQDLKSMQATSGAIGLVIWWDERPRIIPRSAVTPATRAEWMSWKEQA